MNTKTAENVRSPEATHSLLQRLKRQIVLATVAVGEGHIASAFSILDVLWVLYDRVLRTDPENPKSDERDRFILSKGHGSLALYAVLAEKGFFPVSELEHFAAFNSFLGGHPDCNKVPGVDASTGSVGHGLPMGVGMALGLRIRKVKRRVFVLVGDGECNEGSIWEAVLLAAHHRLANLTCIVDYNHSTDRALMLGDLKAKFESFGWAAVTINGHDHTAIYDSLLKPDPDRPSVIVAETVKGWGVKQMESNPAWHHRSPTQEELPGILEGTGMRKQFVRTTEDLMATDDRLVLLLGDIGVFGFRNAFEHYPERTYNIGICEQAMTSVAAGLAREGLVPVLHSIAPFAVERCFEQIKIDLCYQNLPANIVSVGAAYDYAALGGTHHCPEDVAILRTLPGMEIVVPGTPAEFDQLFRAAYADAHPTYFRLSERSNQQSYAVEFGRAHVIQRGSLATVVAVGPTLSSVLEATQALDVTVLYYTTVAPFDEDALRENCPSARVIVVEPFYEGTLAGEVMQAMKGTAIRLDSLGIPHRFLTNYGSAAEHDEAYGLTAAQIRVRLEQLLNE